MKNYNCLLVSYNEKVHKVDLITRTFKEVKKNHVLVKVKYSGLNYKDALSITGKSKIIRKVKPNIFLIPLVAFDNHLNRIGYGKGYYDRILQKIIKIKKNTISIGIAYSFQKCSTIPVNKHDYKLDYIFTERGIISSI